MGYRIVLIPCSRNSRAGCRENIKYQEFKMERFDLIVLKLMFLSLIFAIHFQTIAAANNYWRNGQ